ncbi:tetratricopeptide repeat protein [Christiangramia salexigens]|uniref:Tetratricopeptide repeat protein n=1 Tax=Christiangramia salexigens TaxID=1913577 RepID=A0A1L3J7N6_9FLAO|nr:tetratricopeptide repeat protein [Christiangramia salexigens]APG61139.1 hypothetical protein LPB144_12335 [Christiangramia salexigens]
MLTYLRSLIGVFCLIAFSSHAQNNLNVGVEKLERGEIEQAKSIFLNFKSNPEAVEYLGDIESFKKNWDEAISYYETLVEKEPNNAMYNFKLGGAMGMKAYYGSKLQAGLLLGDIKKYLRRAAELDPEHQEARRALVELYMQLPGILGGSKTIAESYASDLDRINEVDALLADAYIYRTVEYKELAVSKYEEAINLASRKPGLISRNYLNYELGEASAMYEIQLEKGKYFLDEYLKNYGYKDIKSPAWAYLRLAQIARTQNKPDAALKWIDKSLKFDPDFVKAQEEKVRIQRL